MSFTLREIFGMGWCLTRAEAVGGEGERQVDMLLISPLWEHAKNRTSYTGIHTSSAVNPRGVWTLLLPFSPHRLRGVKTSGSGGDISVNVSCFPSRKASFVWPGAMPTSYRQKSSATTRRISMSASLLPTHALVPFFLFVLAGGSESSL